MRRAIPFLLLALAGCEAAVEVGRSGRIYMDPDEPFAGGGIAPPAGRACIVIDEERRARLTHRGACVGQEAGLVRGD